MKCIIGILLSCTVTASLAGDPKIHRDVAYGSGERNVMDIFMPAQVKNPPLVMYIHGGAWFRGDKKQVEDYKRRQLLNDAGVAVATINHTWSQQAVWPAQKEDVVRAIRFLQKNADTYGYDISRFGVWGQSSGAHLALWAGVLDAQDESLGVDAVVSWYAPSNMYMLLHDREADAVPGGNEKVRHPTPEARLLGVSSQKDKAAADAASPDEQAKKLPGDARIAPTLLIHGDMDPRVSPLQSERVFKVFKARGVDVKLMLVKGGKHGRKGFQQMVKPSIDHLLANMNAD